MCSLPIQHLPPEQQQQVALAEEKLKNETNKLNYIRDVEAFADLLEEVGLHEESRKRYNQLLSMISDELSIARYWRKICFSYTNQRDYPNAELVAEKGLEIIKKIPLQSSVEVDEYFNLLNEASLAFYFRNKPEKLEECVTELYKIIPSITDAIQRLRFFYSVSLGMLIKYRWYKLPEEAVTHSQFYVYLAKDTGDTASIALSKAGLAFVHLWREEFSTSRQIFTEAIGLLNEKNYGWLLMCYNYTALGYRMQNNLSMTEQWTNLTSQKAEQTNNQMYLASSYGNLAWIYAKRGNWLYAEDYARKGFTILRKLNPLFYTCVFPLIESLLKRKKADEAGQYVYFLLTPLSKRFPASLMDLLKKAAQAWIKVNDKVVHVLLEEVIAEAKLTGYY